LWALFGGVTAAAVVLGALVALPAELLVFMTRLLSQAIFLVALLGVIHGRGRLRTFCIGGLVAAAYHFIPEIVSPGRADDAILAELLKSLSKIEGSPIQVPTTASLATVPLLRVVELFTSVVTLGFFSVWVRSRIERWQRRPM
jgi:hypothetical protein